MAGALRIVCADAECAATLEEAVKRFPVTASPLPLDLLIWDTEKPLPAESPVPVALLALSTSASAAALPAAGRHYTLPRPFTIARFRRKLEEIARALSEEETESLSPHLSYDPRQRILSHRLSGHSESLTELEARLFKALFTHHGETLARTALLSDIWGYSAEAQTRTLEAHVYRLRQKLDAVHAESPAELEIIAQEEGYQLRKLC